MKHLFYLFTLLLLVSSPHTQAIAQEDVQLTVSAPPTVYIDTPFQIVYTINSVGKELQTPDFKYFDIVAGPFQSRSSYTQIINGKRTSSTTLTYTYTLNPTKKGTFKIPPAHILVNRQKIYSNGLEIKVEDTEKKQTTNSSTQQIDKKSIFIRTTVSKKNIYEQESVLVTYKLYTQPDVTQITDIKLPDFNGFLKQEIEQSNDRQLSYETFDGKNYATVVIYQTLLFPQKTGEINISPAHFTLMLRVKNQEQVSSIFDDFFDTYSNVEKKLTAPGQTIQVKELPKVQKTTNFSGGVGMFTLQSTLSSQKLKTNQAATIKLKLSGIGNLKLLTLPPIAFPNSFETYDPKTTNDFRTTVKGLAGTKTIEYTFIPRHKGTYEIPPIAFSYFDLTSHSYKTIKTPPYQVDVLKGDDSQEQTIISGGDFTNQETVKALNKDIRFIHTAGHVLEQQRKPIIGTTLFWIMFLLPILCTLLLFVYIRKRIKENADTILMKTKKANKVAQQRLKQAKKHLQNNDKTAFYEEIMKAIWSYLSDKLTIPIAQLDKDNIQQAMAKQHIDEQIITQFINILNDCEMASYAPIAIQDTMDITYQKTVEAISEIENSIKR